MKISNIQPTNFTSTPASQPKKKKDAKIIIGVSSAGAAAAGLLLWKYHAASIKSTQGINAIKKEMSQFPKDIEYRKELLKSIGIPEAEYYKFRSIIGCEELKSKLKILSSDIENFLPGKKQFRPDNETIFPGKENVKTGKFAANLHTHTIYSDGQFNIEELLNQAAKYGDDRVAKLGKDNPFYLAITDHDTLKGCKEAVELILKNPDKYKNLRLVLGVEHTTVTDYPNVLNGAVHTHLISYGVNPFDKALNEYFDGKITKNKQNIKNAINFANKNIKPIYSYEEFIKMVPQVEYGLRSADFYIKDYLQFKLIFDSCNKNNLADFTVPISKIEKNPDYSKGQKYYEYYHKAMQTREKLPDEIISALNDIESSAYNKESKMHVPPIEFPDFETVVKFLNTQTYGEMGIAHPGVVFPFANLKGKEDTVKFYEMLYRDFKKWGEDKAVYAEDNYAVYFKQNEPILPELASISSEYGLIKSGGLDTHIKDIFSSK